ncbi:MAG: exopolysaccharide biosynthesis protein, partial [bacterium]
MRSKRPTAPGATESMLIEEERPEPATLVELLDRIQAAAPDEVRVQMGTIVAAVGRRAFGPLLLLAGLITLAPVVGD